MNAREMHENDLIDAARLSYPCGCPECDHGVQPGHFACEQSLQFALDMEERGEFVRTFDNGRWSWLLVE